MNGCAVQKAGPESAGGAAIQSKQANLELRRENEALLSRLAEAEETLRAIRGGEIDAFFASDAGGGRVLPLEPVESGHRVLVEAMNEGAAILNEKGVLLYSNNRLAEMLGRPLEAVIGSSLASLVEPASRADVKELLKKGQARACTGDVSLVQPDGASISVHLSLSPMQIQGRPAICLVVADLTERNEAERALRSVSANLERRLQELQRKNEEVEAFVYIVSHDLRAPLVNVQGFARELQDSCERLRSMLSSGSLAEPYRGAVEEILDDEIAGALHYISASSSKFERLIDALLGLSRQGRQVYRIELLDVQELVASTVATFKQAIVEAGAEVRVGSLPSVPADATALGQVFANLIGNCLKYRSAARRLEIEVGGRLEAGLAHYTVRDNGLGIPASGMARLFQVFQRLHPQQAEGEGMGLAIAHRIVERHQGKIWAESQAGEGTVFHLTLPCDPALTQHTTQEVDDHGTDSIRVHDSDRG